MWHPLVPVSSKRSRDKGEKHIYRKKIILTVQNQNIIFFFTKLSLSVFSATPVAANRPWSAGINILKNRRQMAGQRPDKFFHEYNLNILVTRDCGHFVENNFPVYIDRRELLKNGKMRLFLVVLMLE
jgi:hypothetical protein